MINWLLKKRWRIVTAGMVLSIIPAIAILLYFYFVPYKMLKANIDYEIINSTQIVTSRVSSLIDKNIIYIKAFAIRRTLIDSLKKKNFKDLQWHLDDLIANNPELETAGITTKDGIIVSRVPYDPDVLGKDFSYRDWFKGPKGSLQPYISELFLRKGTPKKYTFAISMPVFDGDNLIGIIFASIKLSYFNSYLDLMATEWKHIYIFDKNGAIVYSSLKLNDNLTILPGYERFFKGDLSENSVVTDKEPFHKDDVFLCYKRLHNPDWCILVTANKKFILAPIFSLAKILSAILILSLVVSGALSLRFATLISRLQELNKKLIEKEELDNKYVNFLSILNQSFTELESFSTEILTSLATITCSEGSILYLQEGGHLKPVSTYLVTLPEEADEISKNAFYNKDVIIVKNILSETVKLETAFATIIPKDIVALPLIYGDEILGVLETACIHGFEDKQLKLLKMCAAQLAISINSINNIKDILHLKEELQKSNDELQILNEELKSQTKELENLNSQLIEASRAKSEFLANMSHELRTPLNSINGYTEVLLDEHYGKINEKQREYLNIINNSGKHLLSLINEILDLSKVEAGAMQLELSDVSIKELIYSSVMMIKEKAMKHNISVNIEIQPETDITLKADERKLKQIFYNLLSNAVKFTEDGGSVTIKTEKKGDFIQFAVIDTGIGIKKEDIKKLFKPFSQLESPYTKKHEGTGLGLALTKKLVELHHGEIGVTSEYGKGSTFFFTIPVNLTEKEIVNVEYPKPTYQGRKKTVLLIDDEVNVINLVLDVLAREGFEVYSTTSAREGIKLAKEKQPGVILLDIIMPDINGFEVLKILKDDTDTKDIPIVILTSADLSTEQLQFIKKYAYDTIIKGALSEKQFLSKLKDLFIGVKK